LYSFTPLVQKNCWLLQPRPRKGVPASTNHASLAMSLVSLISIIGGHNIFCFHQWYSSTMVVSDADNDWIGNTVDDAIEGTSGSGLPDPPGSNNTLYIPQFVPKHVHDGMTEEEMLAAYAMFLKKDWLTPGLKAEIHRHFPQIEGICAETR
jgi:hypothetical protein